MNKIERVRTALAHREPDRVPKGELEVGRHLSDVLAPEAADDFERERLARERLGMDLANSGATWPESEYLGTDEAGRPRYRDWWGMEYIRTEDDMKNVRPGVTAADDVARFRTPRVDDLKYERFQRWPNETDFFIFGQTGGCFDAILWIAGFENCMTWAAEAPDAIRHMSSLLIDLHIAVGKRFIDLGAHLILVGDDMGYNAGTFLSPGLMDELVFPYHKRLVTELKAHSPTTPVILHSDGNLNAVLDRIVACGYDGIHSLQPSAGMDIAKIKAKYGDRLTLMGNIDIDWLLPHGTPEQVAAKVRETLDVAAPGGGYILSTSNVLTRAVPLANALSMYRTADEWRPRKR